LSQVVANRTGTRVLFHLDARLMAVATAHSRSFPVMSSDDGPARRSRQFTELSVTIEVHCVRLPGMTAEPVDGDCFQIPDVVPLAHIWGRGAGTHNQRRMLSRQRHTTQRASHCGHAVWVPGRRSLRSLAQDDSGAGGRRLHLHKRCRARDPAKHRYHGPDASRWPGPWGFSASTPTNSATIAGT
jgi:hypothetical protein